MFLVAANTRQALVGQKEWITTGSSGIQVQFLFSADWDGLAKFAVFRNAEIEESVIPIALPASGLTELPAENCAAEYVDEKVYVGVYGTDGLGHIIIPTIWVSLGVLKEGAAYEGMDPPQPTQDMWAQILAIAQNAGAENAAAAEQSAEEAAEAAEAIQDMNVQAETLPDESPLTVTKEVDPETGAVTLIFGLTRGPKGTQGDDGYSPTITITPIQGGHRFTVTDKDHPTGQSFDVMNGAPGAPGSPGQDGYSPAITITTITGGHRFTVTDEDHPTGQSFDVMDGTKGDQGYSPAITITTITGGHRVTITDEDHPTGQSFDVMDGASDAGQVSYDPTRTYQSGTVGKELSDQSNAISELDDTVNDPKHGLAQKAPLIINTASGDIASFADGADGMPIKSLVASIEPVQDLHGYDNPWPAGGGKNKLQLTGSTYTINGVTFTFNGDGTVTVNGTATANAFHAVADATFLADAPSGTYILNGCPSGGSGFNLDVQGASGADIGDGVTITFSGELTNTNVRIRVYAGTTVNNAVFKPMIRLASETDDTFAPYSNICPISGHTGMTVNRTGFNVWDEEWEVGDYTDNGTKGTRTDRIRCKNFISVKPSTTYYIKSPSAVQNLIYYTASKEVIGIDGNGNFYNRTFTTPDNCYYIAFNMYSTYGTTYNHDISINYPATDTDYHAYTGATIPITWETEAGTVYGGTLDVTSGKLVVKYVKKTVTEFNGVFGTVPNGYCVYAIFSDTNNLGVDTVFAKSNIFTYFSGGRQEAPLFSYGGSNGGATTQAFILPSTVTSLAEANAWLANNPTECTFKLATPTEYTLSANELSTLYGTNNVWTDVGEVSVDYPADTKLYIDGKITEAIANAMNS